MAPPIETTGTAWFNNFDLNELSDQNGIDELVAYILDEHVGTRFNPFEAISSTNSSPSSDATSQSIETLQNAPIRPFTRKYNRSPGKLVWNRVFSVLEAEQSLSPETRDQMHSLLKTAYKISVNTHRNYPVILEREARKELPSHLCALIKQAVNTVKKAGY